MIVVPNEYRLQTSKNYWANIPNTAGIYYIRNIKTNQVYIGSSVNVKKRLQSHFIALNQQKHGVIRLQKDWNAGQAFQLSVVNCPVENLALEEQAHINKIRTTQEKVKLYNRYKTATRPGSFVERKLARQKMEKEAIEQFAQNPEVQKKWIKIQGISALLGVIAGFGLLLLFFWINPPLLVKVWSTTLVLIVVLKLAIKLWQAYPEHQAVLLAQSQIQFRLLGRG